MLWFKKGNKEIKNEAPAIPGVIAFDDFAKVDLRIGQIIEAGRVEKSEKLLKLKVDFGSEKRQVLAGIGKAYAPDALIGKTATFVFNLAPRMMMGLESQGMILAVSDANGLSILSPDKDIAPGTRAS